MERRRSTVTSEALGQPHLNQTYLDGQDFLFGGSVSESSSQYQCLLVVKHCSNSHHYPYWSYYYSIEEIRYKYVLILPELVTHRVFWKAASLHAVLTSAAHSHWQTSCPYPAVATTDLEENELWRVVVEKILSPVCLSSIP